MLYYSKIVLNNKFSFSNSDKIILVFKEFFKILDPIFYHFKM